MKHPFHLRYDNQANVWHDALPMGNGKLGAMVYGHACVERIQLNDDSLWHGAFYDRSNPALREKLPEIRKLVFSGEVEKAEELILQYMVGTPINMRHYSPLGELNLALNQRLPYAFGWLPNSHDAEQYTSDLDLMTGVLEVQHTQAGIRYHREMFVSNPAQVMCIRLTTETPASINLDILMDRTVVSDQTIGDDRRPGKRVRAGIWPATLADSNRSVDDRTILLQGHEAEVGFAAAVRVVCDGVMQNPVSQLLARGCSEVVIYLASSTTNRCADPAAEVLGRLEAAQQKGYGKLYADHAQDFSSLMSRCELDLGPSPDLMTDKRILAVREGTPDPGLAALYFQYGRYLIVSGGRADSAALNLQGIWNAEFMPSWDSKHTININQQMNYWPVEVCNLSELHVPFMDLMKKMHENGKRTAQVMYGMRGMVCHHNTDFYGDCAPQDWYMAATPWTTGGPWMGLHVWEHYLHTRDVDFLKEMYPILRDMALFYVDFLVERDGMLVTCPSVSPENRYILPSGNDTPVCAGPAMDNQILRAFFGVCTEIQRLLEVDAALRDTLSTMASKLPETQIGSKGQIIEWDKEYPELTPGMGHVSHLFACYPGTGINWHETPELMQAVRRSLALRADHGAAKGGWPLAWFVNLHARLLDGEKTDAGIARMLTHSSSRSLLNANRVFQIDGNLGLTAGIAECLLQSHIALHFLPALPASWKEGHVQGLRARGAYEVDLDWKDGMLEKATVLPMQDGTVEVVGPALAVSCEGQTVAITKTDIGFSFACGNGKKYVLMNASPFRPTRSQNEHASAKES